MSEGEKLIPINIEDEMKSAYIDYSMPVIVSRALPDVRDGLKPVHRRVLYGMYELGVLSNRAHKKSARIVGEVLGKYHPHGDTSVYDAMVRMAQEWSLRYLMVDGQGNFGSVDGDSPAAMRYTEARMRKISEEILADIDKETVDFKLNFDDTLEEPTVMPTRVPTLLINGATGIAVGMATNIPPHNLREVIAAVVKIIDNQVEDDRETDIEEILEYAFEMPEAFVEKEQAAVVTEMDLLSTYAADLQDKIRKGIASAENAEQPLTGRHIIVDAGNGAGGFFVDRVLQPLGADTSGSQFLDPDGTFPNHVPNPDNKAAMKSIQDAVIANKADLGIIFDTDVDRSAIVDSDGKAFNRNNLIALISAVLLTEEPGATIVTNSATSAHLETFITELGGVQDRYLTGYRNVINRGIELNEAGTNAVLAIETSGHAALKENYFLDDGAYLIAKLLIADAQLSTEGKHLGDLIATLGQPAETMEYRFTIIEEPIFEVGNAIIKDFAAFIAATEDITLVADHLEGVRVNLGGQYGEGWFILRLSLHEPLLVWTIESDAVGKLPLIAKTVLPFFKGRPELDTGHLH